MDPHDDQASTPQPQRPSEGFTGRTYRYMLRRKEKSDLTVISYETAQFIHPDLKLHLAKGLLTRIALNRHLVEKIQARADKLNAAENVDEAPRLGWLNLLTDWVPSKAVRKRQNKLLADESAEIAQFKKIGRRGLAKWRTAWAVAHWFRYLLTGPLVALVSAIRKFSTG